MSFILLVGDRTQRPDPPSPLTAQTSEVLADSRFRVDRTRGVWTLEMCVYSYIYIYVTVRTECGHACGGQKFQTPFLYGFISM